MESGLVTQNLYRADYEMIILTTLLFFSSYTLQYNLTTLIEILQSN